MMLREIAALSGGHVGGARRSRHAAAALLLLVFLTLMGTASRAGTPAPAPEQHPETGAQPGEWLADAPPCTPGEATGRAVLPFIENLGQTDDKIAFCARTFGGAALVTRDGKIVYALAAAAKNPDGRAVAFIESVDGLQAAPSGLGRSETRVSEFRGNDPARWRTDLPAYEAVDLGTLPGGIRVVLEAHAGNVEMLFVVPPGADPQEIRVSVDGARSLAVNGAGELVVATALGDVAFTAPVAHQEQEGTCEFIDVAYETDGGGYSFTLGKYDPSLELVIDPRRRGQRLRRRLHGLRRLPAHGRRAVPRRRLRRLRGEVRSHAHNAHRGDLHRRPGRGRGERDHDRKRRKRLRHRRHDVLGLPDDGRRVRPDVRREHGRSLQRPRRRLRGEARPQPVDARRVDVLRRKRPRLREGCGPRRRRSRLHHRSNDILRLRRPDSGAGRTPTSPGSAATSARSRRRPISEGTISTSRKT